MWLFLEFLLTENGKINCAVLCVLNVELTMVFVLFLFHDFYIACSSCLFISLLLLIEMSYLSPSPNIIFETKRKEKI